MNHCRGCDAWEEWGEVEVGGVKRVAGECRPGPPRPPGMGQGIAATRRAADGSEFSVTLAAWPLTLADSGCRDGFRPRSDPIKRSFDVPALEAWLRHEAYPGAERVDVDLALEEDDGDPRGPRVTGTVAVVAAGGLAGTRADWPGTTALRSLFGEFGCRAVDVEVVAVDATRRGRRELVP